MCLSTEARVNIITVTASDSPWTAVSWHRSYRRLIVTVKKRMLASIVPVHQMNSERIFRQMPVITLRVASVDQACQRVEEMASTSWEQRFSAGIVHNVRVRYVAADGYLEATCLYPSCRVVGCMGLKATLCAAIP